MILCGFVVSTKNHAYFLALASSCNNHHQHTSEGMRQLQDLHMVCSIKKGKIFPNLECQSLQIAVMQRPTCVTIYLYEGVVLFETFSSLLQCTARNVFFLLISCIFIHPLEPVLLLKNPVSVRHMTEN